MRSFWTFDPDIVYLNHGSFGAVPAVTQEAQRRLQEAAEANPMRWFRDLPSRLVHARDRIGRFLGIDGGGLGFVTNATTGVNVALRSVPLRPGERIVVTSHVYGAVRLAAERIGAARGCQVRVVDLALEASDDEIVAALDAALDGTAGCVVVDQITSATAKQLPAHRIATLARERGVPVIVDGAHSPALIDEPVVGDFWTGNLHKWPCAPRGTGVLYVDPDRRGDLVAPVISWGDPLGFPAAWDAPGTADSTGWLATATSLDLMESLDFAGERKRLAEMVAQGAALIAEAIGCAVVEVGRSAPTMRLIALPDGLVRDDVEGSRLQAILAESTGVEVAVSNWSGNGYLRVSGHLYNSPDDFALAAERFGRLARQGLLGRVGGEA